MSPHPERSRLKDRGPGGRSLCTIGRSARERAELQRQGAKAALRGDGAETNPLLRAANAPAATGDCACAWALRRDAWQAGFDAQRMMRRRRAAGAAVPIAPDAQRTP